MSSESMGNGKKLEIRAYPSKNIHAKVYIGRFGDKVKSSYYNRAEVTETSSGQGLTLVGPAKRLGHCAIKVVDKC